MNPILIHWGEESETRAPHSSRVEAVTNFEFRNSLGFR
jgi:hypothetical protein